MTRSSRASSTCVFMVLTCLLGIGACMKPNPIVAEFEALEAAEGDGDSDDDGDDDDDDNGDGDDDSEAQSSSSDSDDPGQELVDFGGVECSPSEGTTPACDACLSVACCELVLACNDDPDCACVSGCVAAGHAPGQCKQMCGMLPSAVDTFEALASCSQEACVDACPW